MRWWLAPSWKSGTNEAMFLFVLKYKLVHKHTKIRHTHTNKQNTYTHICTQIPTHTHKGKHMNARTVRTCETHFYLHINQHLIFSYPKQCLFKHSFKMQNTYCTSWNFRGGFIFANFASQTLAKISTSIYVYL